MRIVLDPNVFISGVFFAGPPLQILRAWRDGKVKLILSLAFVAGSQMVLPRMVQRYKEAGQVEDGLALVAEALEVIGNTCARC